MLSNDAIACSCMETSLALDVGLGLLQCSSIVMV